MFFSSSVSESDLVVSSLFFVSSIIHGSYKRPACLKSQVMALTLKYDIALKTQILPNTEIVSL